MKLWNCEILRSLLLVATLSSCGSGGGNSGMSDGVTDMNASANGAGEVGIIKAVVTNSKSFNPNISHGQISEYKVTVTGDGIVDPIVATFDGNATSGLIENIPAGNKRHIKVTAINPNQVRIREGNLNDLEVGSDVVTEANVEMNSVPVFANLVDGSTIPNTRFIAKVFSDPSDEVVIEDEFNAKMVPLENTVTPDIATGLANVAPPLMQAGTHKFTIKSTKTGLSTEVTINLADGVKQRPAPVINAGSAKVASFGRATVKR